MDKISPQLSLNVSTPPRNQHIIDNIADMVTSSPLRLDESTSSLQLSSTFSLLQEAAKEVAKDDVIVPAKKLAVISEEMTSSRASGSNNSSPHAHNLQLRHSVKFDDAVNITRQSNPIFDAIDDIQSMMKDIELSNKNSSPRYHNAQPLLLHTNDIIHHHNIIAKDNDHNTIDDDKIMPMKSKEVKLAFDQSWKDRYLEKRSKLMDSQHILPSSSSLYDSNIQSKPSYEAKLLRSSYETGIAYKPMIQTLLTKEKELLFLRMKQVSSSSSSSRSQYDDKLARKPSLSSYQKSAKMKTATVDRLTRRNINNSDNNNTTTTYSRDDDKLNCTFQPKIKKYHNTEGKSESDTKQQFYDRQEALERSRRDKMKESIGMKEYDSLLTKKYCPSCGAKQSYDEVTEKRKKCSICQVEFKSKLAWNTVAHKFLSAEDKFLAKLEDKRRLLEYEIEEEKHMMVIKKFDKNSGKIKEFIEICPSYREDNKWTKGTEEEFFTRLQEYHHMKQQKLQKIADDVSTRLYPFQPSKSLGKTKSQASLDEEDDNIDEGPSFQAFLTRYYDDLQRRFRDVKKIPYMGSSSSKTVIRGSGLREDSVSSYNANGNIGGRSMSVGRSGMNRSSYF